MKFNQMLTPFFIINLVMYLVTPKVFANDVCSQSNQANLLNQFGDISDLGDNLFSDPTNCAFEQAPLNPVTKQQPLDQTKIRSLLSGNPVFNQKQSDRDKLVKDILLKYNNAQPRIQAMRKQMGCQNAEVYYEADGGSSESLMNFKKSFKSDLSAEDLKKFHKIDINDYSKVQSSDKKSFIYVIKDESKFKKNIDDYINSKYSSDRPIYICTDRTALKFGSNNPIPSSSDFYDNFQTGLPILKNEHDVKQRLCKMINDLKPECIRKININTSSDRRSNCDKSKNRVNKNGENECPYVSGKTIGRNDFESLSKDRAEKLENVIMSCLSDNESLVISKNSDGLRGDGSSGVCPYEVVDKEKHIAKLKPEFAKNGNSVKELESNRYANITFESSGVSGCGNYGKPVFDTETISVKCIKIQVKCVP